MNPLESPSVSSEIVLEQFILAKKISAVDDEITCSGVFTELPRDSFPFDLDFEFYAELSGIKAKEKDSIMIVLQQRDEVLGVWDYELKHIKSSYDRVIFSGSSELVGGKKIKVTQFGALYFHFFHGDYLLFSKRISCYLVAGFGGIPRVD
jgi:hypothetical protein